MTDPFAHRRQRLREAVGEDGIAILPTAPERQRNRDVDYPYRPDSDFHYLTGFPEPEAVMVLAPGRPHGEYLLFCRERDPDKETWEGRRAGQEGAVARYGADDSFPIGDLDDILPGLLENRARVYCTMGLDAEFDTKLIGWINCLRERSRAGIHTPGEFVALDHILHEMRLYKGPEEVAHMRTAARISAEAHRRAMQACRPGMMEYALEAEYQYVFRREGCSAPAYPPIVGGGANGCILHYTENEAELQDGDLVLVDAGGEYAGYAADITRTFPVNGRFSALQREVYDIVLAAQHAAIDAVRPGNHWDHPHQAALRVLVQGLVDLGALAGEVDHLIETGAFKPFFMHRTGHWLGRDVHDVGDYKIGEEWRELEPGMALTVEPGLYFAPGGQAPERLQGIGIRIEDDVVVTADGCEVLTDHVPSDPDAIEELMAHE
ncbi:Xaa-Pro aminopeptidase [Thiohalospira halophila DSM 15071]|uniref:Xaa-Pro aminopeptidase n=1 Tax=Thiohalospira halophila DSM 15071 TaxID=1123397 RepID=A0A1I1SHA4_9GAMM|nr:Xaa-Pro aminopeptidase [Thiohalospira halophila]SFD43223.1 Xaa-Pro aminopeptidase [Thiohalospira halophila DSM 15071]